MKKEKIGRYCAVTPSVLWDDFKEAVNLIANASSLLDYEDEKEPTYGIKFRCEKFLKKIKKTYCTNESDN